MLMAHYGSWELLAMFAAQRGYALHIVAKKFKNDAVNQLWNRLRERYGIMVVYAHNAARPIMRALRNKHACRFHARPAPAACAGCVRPILRPSGLHLAGPCDPVLAVAGAGDSRLHPPPRRWRPPYPRAAGDSAAPRPRAGDHPALHPALHDRPRKEIRAQPAEWIWIHRRWKTQPLPGDAIATPEPAAVPNFPVRLRSDDGSRLFPFLWHWFGVLSRAMLSLFVNVFAHRLALRSRPAMLRLGARLGWFYGRVVRHRRTEALAALRRSLPELSAAEATAAIDGMYRNLTLNLLEILRMYGGATEELEALMTIEGEDIVKAALARGRGAMILTAHLGNFDMLAMFAAQRHYPLTIISKKLKNAA